MNAVRGSVAQRPGETVDGEGRVPPKNVTVSHDFGSIVELAGDVERGDRIIDSPPDGIANGDRVRVAAALERP
jgi:hypothetical protein